MNRFYALDADGPQAQLVAYRYLSDIVPDLAEEDFDALYTRILEEGFARVEYEGRQLLIKAQRGTVES